MKNLSLPTILIYNHPAYNSLQNKKKKNIRTGEEEENCKL